MRTVLIVATVVAILAALAMISACSTTSDGMPSQQVVNERFDQACFTLKAADIAFHIAAGIAPKVIDAEAIAWEAKVMSGIVAICDGPPPNVSSSTAIINSLLDAAGKIAEVVKRAREAEGAFVESPT